MNRFSYLFIIFTGLIPSMGLSNGCVDRTLGICFESALQGGVAGCDSGISEPACPREQLVGTCFLGERFSAVKFHYYQSFQGDPKLECDDSGGTWTLAPTKRRL